MYVDGSGPVDVLMDLPAGTYSYAWIDVARGGSSGTGEFVHGGGEKTLRSPAFRGGIALRLTRKGESK